LDEEQIRFFNENGYLRLERLTTPEEAQQIRAALKELFEKRAGEKEGAFADLVAGARHIGGFASLKLRRDLRLGPEPRLFRR